MFFVVRCYFNYVMFFNIYLIIFYEERDLKLVITALCLKHITAVEL